jgi:hypothetical protein
MVESETQNLFIALQSRKGKTPKIKTKKTKEIFQLQNSLVLIFIARNIKTNNFHFIWLSFRFAGSSIVGGSEREAKSPE